MFFCHFILILSKQSTENTDVRPIMFVAKLFVPLRIGGTRSFLEDSGKWKNRLFSS